MYILAPRRSIPFESLMTQSMGKVVVESATTMAMFKQLGD
jgi:hypothetical protein